MQPFVDVVFWEYFDIWNLSERFIGCGNGLAALYNRRPAQRA